MYSSCGKTPEPFTMRGHLDTFVPAARSAIVVLVPGSIRFSSLSALSTGKSFTASKVHPGPY